MTTFDDKDAKVYVAGHRDGRFGDRARCRPGFSNIVTRTSAELDLRNQAAVNAFFAEEEPDYVFLAAAKVGGILANDSYPADFIYDNLVIETNIIHAAFRQRAKKLLFLGSTCIYPKLAQPLKEEYLLSGPLEPTNEWYAVAKIAGIKAVPGVSRQHGCDFIRRCRPTCTARRQLRPGKVARDPGDAAQDARGQGRRRRRSPRAPGRRCASSARRRPGGMRCCS